MSRVVVVTGASGGIGRASVAEFARRGDRIALIARGKTGLDAAAAECRELGATTFTVPVDVSDAQAVADAVDRIESELGPIDVWVNVAFTSVFARFDDITPEEYRRATEV
ncbi:MAG: SDR family NAD(P)-dependent oxidoreductase, partial [Lapillicoccus sp.]